MNKGEEEAKQAIAELKASRRGVILRQCRDCAEDVPVGVNQCPKCAGWNIEQFKQVIEGAQPCQKQK